MITILLAGQARVGKTTAAELIQKEAKKRDYKPIILPFAKAIKDEATKAGYDKETKPEEYRKYCQAMGESKRAEDPDHWVKMFKKQWMSLYEKDNEAAQSLDKLWKETVVIVDDCRYLNELNFGKSIGAKTVFISKGTRKLVESDAEWRKHESEDMANQYESGNKDYLDIFDWVINNAESKTEFESKLKTRIPLWLESTPLAYVECDCVGCKAMKKDTPVPLEDFIKELFDMDEEDDD